MAAYLTATEADTLAATLLVPAAWAAATTPRKAAALEMASARIDGLPWQGRKFEADQEREFPRVAYPSRAPIAPPYGFNADPGRRLTSTPAGVEVWDWDQDEDAAVVPTAVKQACLLEAASLLDGTRQRLLDARHAGLAAQSTGDLSETYAPGATGSDGLPKLCEAADLLLRRYRLTTGRLR